MPEEVMIIAITAIIAGTFTVTSIVRAIARSVQAKSRPSDGSPSLTQSELRRLLREAVEEATLPLYAQMQELERKLDRGRQLEPPRHSAPAPLEIPEEPEREEVERPRRAVRH